MPQLRETDSENSPLLCPFVRFLPSKDCTTSAHIDEGIFFTQSESNANLFQKQPHRHTLKPCFTSFLSIPYPLAQSRWQVKLITTGKARNRVILHFYLFRDLYCLLFPVWLLWLLLGWLLFLNFILGFTILRETRDRLCEKFLRVKFSTHSSDLPNCSHHFSAPIKGTVTSLRKKQSTSLNLSSLISQNYLLRFSIGFFLKDDSSGLPWNNLLIHWQQFHCLLAGFVCFWRKVFLRVVLSHLFHFSTLIHSLI